MKKLKDIIPIFEKLVGEESSFKDCDCLEIDILENNKEIGYSQFNEILLLLGFNRVSKEFFQFLCNGKWAYKHESSIKNVTQFNDGIDRFTKIALLFYGNIRFAYKALSNNPELLYEKIIKSLPRDITDFTKRHPPLLKIKEIPPQKTYLLGYLVDQEIKDRLKNPEDVEAINLQLERTKFVKIGIQNQRAYLASDHLDIYVATSMRLPHEFLFVSNFINKVFKSNQLSDLKLRWFDPTQAYCEARIDKGLSEALMLKRAFCTLYLAQESETFGKDSELASTLAQGKPVIAYVPIGDKVYVNELLKNLMDSHSDEKQVILEQIQIFAPNLAWYNKKIRNWLNNPEEVSVLEMKDELYTLAEKYYNKRAKTLTSNHPLGIQVNLESGVANGVLVVRNVEDCISLIKNIVTDSMEFDIERNFSQEKDEIIYLREKITKSIFRIKSNDQLLTNSFWNFYITNE